MQHLLANPFISEFRDLISLLSSPSFITTLYTSSLAILVNFSPKVKVPLLYVPEVLYTFLLEIISPGTCGEILSWIPDFSMI